MRSMAILVLFAASVIGSAQSLTEPSRNLAFEVASVKPNISGSFSSTTRTLPNGTFQMLNASVKSMIVNAYDVRPFQVVGGPGWIESDRFDIVAKAPGNDDGGQMPLMLRSLLAERFKLMAHTEMREQPVYGLVLVRADRQLGPQIKMSTRNCSGSQPAPASPCGMNMTRDGRGGTMRGQAVSIEDLAGALGGVVERSVVNRTGLTGLFDIDLRFTTEGATGGIAGDAPSVFSALQEQLGLQLESQRGPVAFLVIDRVELPTAD